MNSSRKSLKAVLWSVAVLLAVALAAGPVAAATFASGDVLVSVGNGKWNWYDSTGAVKGTLNDASGSAQTTGGAFNAAGEFYGTDFAAKNVHNFDTSGVLIGAVGSGYTFSPESILFGCVNSVDSILVGTSDPSGTTGNILQFDTSGNLLNTFVVDTENKGADWIELLSDHCTVNYTSEGYRILSFNLCTNSQNADFVTAGSGLLNHSVPNLDAAYTLRQINGGTYNGQWLLADNSTILRINAAGSAVLQTYDDAADPGEPGFGVKTWYGLSVDPDGLGFWASDFQSGYLDHFVIGTGAVNHTLIIPAIHSPGAGGVIVSGTVLQTSTCPTGVCPLSQGYWKNHPGKWPAGSVPMTLGTHVYTTQASLLKILNNSSTGDASVILGRQLIAANLNILAGATPTPDVSAAIADGNTQLGAGIIPEKVKTTSNKGKKMVTDAGVLDQFNNGLLTEGCAEVLPPPPV